MMWLVSYGLQASAPPPPWWLQEDVQYGVAVDIVREVCRNKEGYLLLDAVPSVVHNIAIVTLLLSPLLQLLM